MSNNNTTVKQIYLCDGLNTTFAIPFFFLEGEESVIKAYLVDNDTSEATLLTLGLDYTVNSPATEVTTTTAYPSTNSVMVKRVSEFVQLSEFAQGPFPYEAVEEQFDRVVSQIQEISSTLTEYISLPEGTPIEDLEFPVPVADQLIGWNALGTGLENKAPLDPALVFPVGGAIGAALTKQTVVDGETEWDDLVFEGYSSRFATNWSSAGLRDTLEKILAITYLGPLIASFSGSSNILREKGTTVATVTLTVNVTKRSNNIAQIRFLQGATILNTYAPPVVIGSGATAEIYSIPFTDNITFSVQVTDAIVGLDGGNMVSASTTYSFVYPYYYGAAGLGLTPSGVAGLTKSVVNENTSYNRTFTTSNGDVYYFAYPASYGNLTSILDENGFETFSAWTKTTSNITGLDTTAVSYNIYESNNPVTAGTTNFTFKQ